MKNMSDNSIDLIYLDPPFNSKKTYNLMYKNMVGEPVSEQVEAFCDCWEMDAEKQDLIDNMEMTMSNYHMDADFVAFWNNWIKALRHSRPKMLAYLLYMFVRLLEMKRILKDTGSIYYHCDPTASHYIKVIMDGIFGHDNFRNEIVWSYQTGGTSKKWFSRKHDIIFFYSKNKDYFIDLSKVKNRRTEKSLARARNPKGARISIDNIYKLPDDVWNIQALNPMARERLGYPTQKPIPLLDRIIKASCPEGGLVLDPFCGCGTTIYSALLNNRKWIGIDIAILSTRLVKETLKKRYDLEEDRHYKIDGIPVSVEEARFLWEKDKFQFQNWAVEYVNGFCTNNKTRDGGVDGRKYFKEVGLKDKELKSMIISVKGGKLHAQDIRDLIGTVEKERAVFGGLISFDEPSKMMREESAKMGMYEHKKTSQKYPRIQFLTIKEMLDEKKLFNMPENVNRKDTKKDLQERFYFH